eukprot:scaffold7368_cov114-Skeletonema_marinoi.AAC.4
MVCTLRGAHCRASQITTRNKKRMIRLQTYSMLLSREIRYGRQQRSARLTQMPHQVTYDVVATLKRPNNA